MRNEHIIWLTASAVLVVIYGTFLFDRPVPMQNIKEVTMLATVVVFGFLVPFFAYSGKPSMLGPAITLYIAGAYILYKAMSTLGKHFSPTIEFQQDHQLLTTGIYSWIRHPMYTAFLLFAAAHALLLPSTVGWASIGLTVALVFLVRVPLEEQALRAEFGEEYARYANHVAGIIPGIF